MAAVDALTQKTRELAAANAQIAELNLKLTQAQQRVGVAQVGNGYGVHASQELAQVQQQLAQCSAEREQIRREIPAHQLKMQEELKNAAVQFEAARRASNVHNETLRAQVVSLNEHLMRVQAVNAQLRTQSANAAELARATANQQSLQRYQTQLEEYRKQIADKEKTITELRGNLVQLQQLVSDRGGNDTDLKNVNHLIQKEQELSSTNDPGANAQRTQLAMHTATLIAVWSAQPVRPKIRGARGLRRTSSSAHIVRYHNWNYSQRRKPASLRTFALVR